MTSTEGALRAAAQSSPAFPSSPLSTSSSSSHGGRSDVVHHVAQLVDYTVHSVRSSASTLLHHVQASSPLHIRALLLLWALLHVVLPCLFLHARIARTVLGYTLCSLVAALCAVQAGEMGAWMSAEGQQRRGGGGGGGGGGGDEERLPAFVWAPSLLLTPLELLSLLFPRPQLVTVEHTDFVQLPPLLLSARLFLLWYQLLLVADSALLVMSLQHITRSVRVGRSRRGALRMSVGDTTALPVRWAAELTVHAGPARAAREESGEWSAEMRRAKDEGWDVGKGTGTGEHNAMDEEGPRAPPSSPASSATTPEGGSPPMPAAPGMSPRARRDSGLRGRSPARGVHSCEVPLHGAPAASACDVDDGRRGQRQSGGESRGDFQSPRPVGDTRRLRSGSLLLVNAEPCAEQSSAPHGDPVLAEAQRTSSSSKQGQAQRPSYSDGQR